MTARRATTAQAAPHTTPHVATTGDTPSPVKSIKRIGKSTPKPIKRIGRADNPGAAMRDARERADSHSWYNGGGGFGGTGGFSLE
ncbi:hypothetical protein [Streptomyces sp. NPDC048357]|uniref:hypothetical protein n=1 Tax=Streptomyces sp. NPDC048357 TaxID=3154719 RepID=UPI0034197833